MSCRNKTGKICFEFSHMLTRISLREQNVIISYELRWGYVCRCDDVKIYEQIRKIRKETCAYGKERERDMRECFSFTVRSELIFFPITDAFCSDQQVQYKQRRGKLAALWIYARDCLIISFVTLHCRSSEAQSSACGPKTAQLTKNDNVVNIQSEFPSGDLGSYFCSFTFTRGRIVYELGKYNAAAISYKSWWIAWWILKRKSCDFSKKLGSCFCGWLVGYVLTSRITEIWEHDSIAATKCQTAIRVANKPTRRHISLRHKPGSNRTRNVCNDRRHTVNHVCSIMPSRIGHSWTRTPVWKLWRLGLPGSLFLL